MILNYGDIPFIETLEYDDLSIRAQNILKAQNLNTLNQILDYYEVNGTFLKVKNCGVNTENELIALCKKNEGLQSKSILIKPLDEWLTKLYELSPYKKSILNRHINYIVSNLSPRAKNGLSSICDNLIPSEILDTVLIKDIDLAEIRSVGEKTISELEVMKNEIQNFVGILHYSEGQRLGKENAKAIIKNSFVSLPENFDFELCFDLNGKIKLFRLIQELIDENQIFNSNEKTVFQTYYSFQSNEVFNLQLIADSLGLTRERVRQIKAKLDDKVETYFSFVSNFVYNDLTSYGIDVSLAFQTIDKYFADKTNHLEKVEFNSTFYTVILGILLKKTHAVLGDDETINGKRKTSNRKNYQSCYLIRTNYSMVSVLQILLGMLMPK